MRKISLPVSFFDSSPPITSASKENSSASNQLANLTGAAVGCETFASNTATDLVNAGTITFA